MPQYSHTIYKQGAAGASQEPPQSNSNGGDSSLFDKALTLKNAAVVGIAAHSGLKVIKTAQGALVDQIGSAQLKETLGYIAKGTAYTTIAVSTGNPYIVAGAVVVDVASSGIQQAVYRQGVRYENEYLQASRGKKTVLGGNYG